MTVFCDTKFTDLTSDSDLLSIGFAEANSDAELCIEILDANRVVASHFVRAEVFPLFGQHNPQVLRRTADAVRIEEWLDGLRECDRNLQIIMLSDSTWDWPHLLELFIPMPGEPPWAQSFNVVGRTVHSVLGSGRQSAAFGEALELFHRQHTLRHHALVDVRALKVAFWDSRLS